MPRSPAKGVGKGDGWGGPPKGPGRGGPRRPFTAGSPTQFKFGGPADQRDDLGHTMPGKRTELKRAGAEREAQIKEHLANLALNAERQETQVTASVAWLNRELGMPGQTNRNENRDMTLEKMVAEAARLREKKPV